jgi:DNA-directed RNA polymerase subunit M/transcription elongation factor TFIIS
MNRLFVAFDGDNMGSQVGQAVLMDDAQQLHEISRRIDSAGRAIQDWVESNGGQMVSVGGDEGTFVIDPSMEEHLEELRGVYQQISGGTVTFGVGYSLSQAGKALMAGKLMGKDILVRYDDQVDHILSDAHDQVQTGGGSPEAQKQDEHYLSHVVLGDAGNGEEDVSQESADEYDMAPTSNSPDDQEITPEGAAAAQEMVDDAANSEGCNCPACQERHAMEAQGQGPEEEATEGCDCPACQERHAMESGAEEPMPEMATQNEEDLPEQDSMQMIPDAQAEGSDLPPMQMPESQEDPQSAMGEMGEEDAIEIPENESLDEQKDPEEMVAAAVGPNEDPEQEGAVPEENMSEDGFPGAIPGEGEEPVNQEDLEEMQDPSNEQMPPQQDMGAMGESQEQPGDLDLLSELLSDAGSTDELKQRIAAILEKFKANRDSIISMKDQNPEMYQSIILMLKQMIDMARHLAPSSPEEDMPQDEQSVPEEASQEEAPLPKQ